MGKGKGKKPDIRIDRAALEGELARVAYSIERGEREGHRESAGWYALRGAFAALAYALGLRDDPLPPEFEDDDEQVVAESAFQALLDEHGAKFTDREAADAQGPRATRHPRHPENDDDGDEEAPLQDGDEG